MMGFFDEIKSTIPPFQEYYKHIYQKQLLKQITPIDSNVIPLLMLKNELCSTTSEVNQQIIQITASLGSVSATALLKELRDPKKATSDHMLRVDGKFS